MHILQVYWRNTAELPSLLNTLCRAGMLVSPILLLFSIYPFSDMKLNGQPITFQESWASGFGLAFFSMAALSCIGCWGIAARQGKARWALVLAAVVPTAVLSLWPVTSFTIQGSYFGLWVSSLITAPLIFLGLFRVASVNEYFFKSLRRDV